MRRLRSRKSSENCVISSNMEKKYRKRAQRERSSSLFEDAQQKRYRCSSAWDFYVVRRVNLYAFLAILLKKQFPENASVKVFTESVYFYVL